MRIISAMFAQYAEGAIILFTMPAVPRKKSEKGYKCHKGKGGSIMHFVNHKETGLYKITFKELPTLDPSHALPAVYYLNVLWHSSHLVLQNSCPNSVWFYIKNSVG